MINDDGEIVNDCEDNPGPGWLEEGYGDSELLENSTDEEKDEKYFCWYYIIAKYAQSWSFALLEAYFPESLISF